MTELKENGIRGAKVLKVEDIRDSDWFEEKPDWWKFCFNDAVDNEMYHLKHDHWHLAGDVVYIPVRHPDAGIGGTSSIKIPSKFFDLDYSNKNPS